MNQISLTDLNDEIIFSGVRYTILKFFLYKLELSN
jgi:hypothetical protein